ncbi:efflux RND transporter periplasmic adaptor subunit [bacterium]|nr:efflux RND transporter periplasmic adaptor subunit [bacterium]MDB4381086.1 efflux RND transporter periplasmic adaptor subunit [Mariniblastus sp.]MDB4545148.1 efflux RND transporter periplasmic adaptor subunit [bacterium]
MKRNPPSAIQSQPQFYRIFVMAVTTLFLSLMSTVVAQTDSMDAIDGFIAPYRSIELSSDEAGAIADLIVEEGDVIKAGGTVARLDDRVQELQVEIAEELAQTTSQLIAANQLLEKRKEISRRLDDLKKRGHASQSEIIRAEMELSIAQAKVLAAKEEKAVRKIELRRAEVQLDRRTISSPFDGIVAKIHRREGEFLSPLHPEVATIIQVNKLLASFAIMSDQLSEFEIDKEYTIRLENGSLVKGTVYRIGVETDSQSGTVDIKLLIQNPTLKLRSGESCSLSF